VFHVENNQNLIKAPLDYRFMDDIKFSTFDNFSTQKTLERENIIFKRKLYSEARNLFEHLDASAEVNREQGNLLFATRMELIGFRAMKRMLRRFEAILDAEGTKSIKLKFSKEQKTPK
jgi:hypothetical protein